MEQVVLHRFEAYQGDFLLAQKTIAPMLDYPCSSQVAVLIFCTQAPVVGEGYAYFYMLVTLQSLLRGRHSMLSIPSVPA